MADEAASDADGGGSPLLTASPSRQDPNSPAAVSGPGFSPLTPGRPRSRSTASPLKLAGQGSAIALRRGASQQSIGLQTPLKRRDSVGSVGSSAIQLRPQNTEQMQKNIAAYDG